MDTRFLSQVQDLCMPVMGTDNVAPLLYSLVRMLRPRRILEVGMGYTTPFLARALQDNIAAIEQERALLASNPKQLPLGYGAYYEAPYEPKLVCVDRMTDSNSSAARVYRKLQELDLAHRCEIIEGDIRDSQERVTAALGTIDLAWIDTWDTLAFVRSYWSSIDPAGGILAVHYLMTYPQGRAVIQYLQSLRGIEGGKLELLNLREPHKTAQNSLTLVRRVRDYQDPEDLRPDGEKHDPPSPLTQRPVGPYNPQE